MVQGFQRVPNLSGVFAVQEEPMVLSRDHIQALLFEAEKTGKKRARLLLHKNVDDSLHEMIIALPKDSFDRPHINFKSGKSFLALHGAFAVVSFSEKGDMNPPKILSADSGNIMVRFNSPTWHTIVPISGPCVFLETIIGPFQGNHFAPFSPEVQNEKSFLEYANRIRQKVYA